jgi:hypothetical protein
MQKSAELMLIEPGQREYPAGQFGDRVRHAFVQGLRSRRTHHDQIPAGVLLEDARDKPVEVRVKFRQGHGANIECARRQIERGSEIGVRGGYAARVVDGDRRKADQLFGVVLFAVFRLAGGRRDETVERAEPRRAKRENAR